MNPIVMMALRKADEIRRHYKFDMYQPINIYDLCLQMDITVRFVEINMEGMYFVQSDGSCPQILISNKRPMPRRNYTCAHELGHHLFKHGSKIDSLTEARLNSKVYDKDEFLVDTFAGALLMPIVGVLSEFAKRNWNISSATPSQFYIISSVFGTGYQSLIVHCQKNNILSDLTAKLLLRQTSGKILQSILGSGIDNSHFKIIDSLNVSSVIDIETSNYIILPSTVNIEGNHLHKFKDLAMGTSYIAEQPGITRVLSASGDQNYFIRIQNSNYIGLAEYRHLEYSN